MALTRRLIDIGANLTDPAFKGIYNGSQKHASDLAEVLKRAFDNGIHKIIITGGNLEDSKKAIELAGTNEALYATVGCHPTRCLEFEAEGGDTTSSDTYLSSLTELIASNKSKVVAVGECGLDYDRLHFCPKDLQLKYFEKQLNLAESTGLPLFLHCRNAAADLIEILERNRDRFTGGVVHSFDGSLQEAEKFIEMNLFIGINGCSLKTEANVQVVSQLPSDKIMIETDSPWCEIKPTHASYNKFVKTRFESKKKEKFQLGQMVKGRNEPVNLVQVLEAVAGIKEEDIEQLAQQLALNTEKLFNF